MKVIYPCQTTRVPTALLDAVREAYEERKKTEPNLRVIDVWFELVRKVKK